MLKAAAERGWLNEKDAVLEALLCLKRAGSGARAGGCPGKWKEASVCQAVGRWCPPSARPHMRLILRLLLLLLLISLLLADLILTYYATEAARWMAADRASWR